MSAGKLLHGKSIETAGRPTGMSPTTEPLYPKMIEKRRPTRAAIKTPGTKVCIALPMTMIITDVVVSATARNSHEPGSDRVKNAPLTTPTLASDISTPNVEGSRAHTIRIATAEVNPVITARDIR